ncbi:hypothetical protein ADL01_12525 [Streptomyces sp. NRRL WC-3618]|uniref:hypothetical protein n=1 Tax=Streptomyces sp. NRRL WC-3618 TaxID=1519490 RepID=UPI0006B04355|nr:hypothetical protein [Streptomyces sp. NRRL WC-3618]KOV80234.1 hypothetical protein ADL01_12525 [Streptomyces sp. NRRL WC-3618]
MFVERAPFTADGAGGDTGLDDEVGGEGAVVRHRALRDRHQADSTASGNRLYDQYIKVNFG